MSTTRHRIAGPFAWIELVDGDVMRCAYLEHAGDPRDRHTLAALLHEVAGAVPVDPLESWPRRLADALDGAMRRRLADPSLQGPTSALFAAFALGGGVAHVCTAGDLRVQMAIADEIVETTRDHVWALDPPAPAAAVPPELAATLVTRQVGGNPGRPPETWTWPVSAEAAFWISSSQYHQHRDPDAYGVAAMRVDLDSAAHREGLLVAVGDTRPALLGADEHTTETSLADELRELARFPTANHRLLPRLEKLLDDHSPARVSIPAMYGDIAFLAAHALAAVRRESGDHEPVVARGVAHPLDDKATTALCILSGLDPTGADPLAVIRQLMARGAWPLADLRIPGELTPRDPALLATLIPAQDTSPPPASTPRQLDDRELRERIHDLATGDPQTRVRALPHPLSEKSGSAELRSAIEACLDDPRIAIVDWFGSAPPGKGPWLGEVRWAAAWSLAWERRVAGIDEPVVVDDVLVPVPRAEAERIARSGRNAAIGFLADAIARERANLPRRRLEIAPGAPLRPADDGVERLRAAIAAGDRFRIDIVLDSIAGGHWDDPRFEPMLEAMAGTSATVPPALSALRAVLRPGKG
jgi:hypothetical protein